MQNFVLKGSINEKFGMTENIKLLNDITRHKLFREPFKIEWVTAYIERSEADLSGGIDQRCKDRTKLIYQRYRRGNIHSIIQNLQEYN